MKVNMSLDMILDGLKILLKSAIPILLFEIIYKGLVVILIKPILSLTFSFFMKLSGYKVLVNEYIISFITSIFGIITLLFFGIIAVLIVYYEFAVILIMLNKSYSNEKIKIRESLAEGFMKVSKLLKHNNMGLALYILVLIPFINIGVQSAFLPEINIPKFISGEILKYPGGEIIIILFILLCIGLYAKSFLVLPAMVLEEVGYRKARKKSFFHMKGKALQVSIVAILLILVWLSIASIPAFLLAKTTKKLFGILKLISQISLVVFSILVSPMILSFMLVAFKPFEEKVKDEFWIMARSINISTLEIMFDKLKEKIKIRFRSFKNKIKNSPVFYIILVLIIAMLIYSNIPMNIIYDVEDTRIIGHRGSLEGVENTIESVKNAAKMGAEYAEIDVLLSKDGVPMVIHDANLLRLSGKNIRVGELTAEELENIRISDRGYSGRISSLEDFYVETEKDIKLLIEFKTHGRENKSIVDETMKVLYKLNFDNNTIFQTTEMKILEEFRENYPEHKIGYIIIGRLGKLNKGALKSLDADFLVFEESIVNQSLVNTIHILNMPIYVWTVNDLDVAEDLLRMKVDGIITDYPDLMSELKEEVKSNSILNKLKNND